jgi:MOSC domain-containing protein YiiM
MALAVRASYAAMMIESTVEAIFIGSPQPLRNDGTLSSIGARRRVEKPIRLGFLGFEGDQVGDPLVHGGPDKAVHFYPSEHYAAWQAHFAMKGLDPHPLLDAAGGFGENISAPGLTEPKVYIGDRFRLGDAIVEVAQGRQPCWKIDQHFGMQGVTAALIFTGRCGLYFRVIKEGMVRPGDQLLQIEQASHGWTIARTFRLLIGGGHKEDSAQPALHELAEMSVLAESWRLRAASLIKADKE